MSSTLITAGGRIKCAQCQATSKRTSLQCKAPAMKSKAVCRTHGGKSTGPRTSEGRKRCAEVRTIHGRETQEIRAERGRKAAELRLLMCIGNFVGLFNPSATMRGRKPTVLKEEQDQTENKPSNSIDL